MMFKGINKVVILGHIGVDPDIKYMQTGMAVVNINVATSDSRKNKITNEIETKTEWHKIVLYNKLGEFANNYLKKGSRVYIEGSLRTSKWKDKDGFIRSITKIIANDLQILDFKSNKPEFSKTNDFSEENLSDDQNKLGVFDEKVPF